MRQKDLAKQLGISSSALSQLIYRKSQWNLERAASFAKAIGKPINFLRMATPEEIKRAIELADKN